MLYRFRPSEGAAAASGAEDEEAPFSFGLAVRVGRAVSVICNVTVVVLFSYQSKILAEWMLPFVFKYMCRWY